MTVLIEEKGIIWDGTNFKNLKQREVVNWFDKIPKKWTRDISKFHIKCFVKDPEFDARGFFLKEEGEYFIYLKDCFPKSEMKYIFCHEIGHLVWEFLSEEEKNKFISNADEDDVFVLKECLRDSDLWDYEKIWNGGLYNELFAWEFSETVM
tara:strand:- start:603 stop:1055 length:453 start_codon:yes stop_codon:yes gene_type:complete